MPGPVTIAKYVTEAYLHSPVSHRSKQFVKDFQLMRKELCKLVNANNVHLMTGSGTTINDYVAMHLSHLPGKGLVLVNGEFGERLIDHAARIDLDFEILRSVEGYTFDKIALQKMLEKADNIEWIWAVHCETSLGVLNDISQLRDLCSQYKIKLCLDCISSIGAIPVDLRGIYLATATSGKALGSYPGIAILFFRDDVLSIKHRLPRYYDLRLYDSHNGIPFTISTNAIYALLASILKTDWKQRYSDIVLWSTELMNTLETYGLNIVAESSGRAQHVITISLPAKQSSEEFGDMLADQGVFVSYRSDYLMRKNYIQVCFMGDCQPANQVLYKELLSLS